MIGDIPSHTNTSSNGVTKTLAIYGLPFALLLFGSYYWAFGKLLGGFLMSTVPFLMLMIFLFGESYYINAPVCLAIISAAFVYERSPGTEQLDRKVGVTSST